MSFGALPPEINSGRMYAGPGSGSMLAAAAAWDGLASELHSAASSYSSVISGLTSEPWLGPSSTALTAAITPYLTWMNATAGQAEQAAAQARAAAGAHQAAFAMTVPPPVIAANRAQLTTLAANNFFGQNNPAIAATEGQYGEMWAQDAAAMYGYAANSAAATQVTPFTAAPQTTNPAGQAGQAAAVGQAAGTSTGTGVQSALSQLVSTISTALQSLASPAPAAATPIVNPFGGITDMSGFSLGGLLTSSLAMYTAIPGWFGISWSSALIGSMLGPLMGSTTNLAFTPATVAANQAAYGAAAAAGAAEAAGVAAGAAAAQGVLPGFGAGLGGLAGLGQAASVGALSVPSSWGWAAAAAPVAGLAPAAVPLEFAGAGVADLAGGMGGLGFPMLLGGIPRAAAAGAAGVAGGLVAAKYGSRHTVMARPPDAGHPSTAVAATPAYPLPAGLPAPAPGYRPAIVYLPIDGHATGDG